MISRDAIAASLSDYETLIAELPLIRRQFSVADNVNYCLVGIRRSGKSYLMYQRYRDLLERGVSSDEMLYVSFEDERINGITAQELNLLLEVKMEMMGGVKVKYVFLDEIQNVDGWEHFARRLADMKYSVCITGSNAKMLSTDVASTLGGRFMVAAVYPYSFREYLAATGVAFKGAFPVSTPERAAVAAAFKKFMQYGGFPEVVDVAIKLDYLNNVYKAIFLGDIVRRHAVRDGGGVEVLLKKVAESVTKPVAVNRLKNVAADVGYPMSPATVVNYLDYMKEAFLLFSVVNAFGKLTEKLKTPKYYFMDTGLLATYPNRYDTALLENAVALELLRRYGPENVMYYNDGRSEVDFYVPSADLAIQVCWELRKTASTFERETEALRRFAGFKPEARRLILTLSESERLTVGGVEIEVMPAWRWMLQA